MSYIRYLTLKSFRFHNPEWIIDLYVAPQNDVGKTWIDNVEQDFFVFNGEDYTSLLHDLDINIKGWIFFQEAARGRRQFMRPMQAISRASAIGRQL